MKEQVSKSRVFQQHEADKREDAPGVLTVVRLQVQLVGLESSVSRKWCSFRPVGARRRGENRHDWGGLVQGEASRPIAAGS